MILAWFRRRRARARPFPPEWREILAQGAPFYRRLRPDARARFEDTLKVIVYTKHWEGAMGFTIDDRVRVLVAAAAARLSMNLRPSDYPRLTEIVVHPSTYVHPDGNVVFGEAHRFGTIVLSWDAVVQGLRNPDDGHDTALHEFAHVLDVSDGAYDGTPPLSFHAYGPWARIMSRSFLNLRAKGSDRRRTVLRRYGATNEAEFFAVASETFFEKPLQLRKKEPELYAILADYFGSDPAADEDVP
jgi:MtfA peptidase